MCLLFLASRSSGKGEKNKARSVTPRRGKASSFILAQEPPAAGKIWLKPKKEDKGKNEHLEKKDKISEPKKSVGEGSWSEPDFVKSIRPNSFISSGVHNERIVHSRGKDVPEGLNSGAKIESPEEIIEAKSSSPEHLNVEIESGVESDFTNEDCKSGNFSLGLDSNENLIKEKSIEPDQGTLNAGNHM